MALHPSRRLKLGSQAVIITDKMDIHLIRIGVILTTAPLGIETNIVEAEEIEEEEEVAEEVVVVVVAVAEEAEEDTQDL